MASDINYGDLVLVCGDLFVTKRVQSIQSKLINLFGNKLQHVICTGNVGNQETFNWLKGLSDSFYISKGQFDDDISDINQEIKCIKIGTWKILVLHGHQVVPWGDEETLNVYLKEYDCDLAIYGNTHESKVSKLEKKYFLNPGTMTGAYGGCKQENNIPCEFLILEILGNEIGVFRYKLINGELMIEKCNISK